MVHSVSGCTRGVQVKLWDPLRTRAIPERLVFTTRRYTFTLPYLTYFGSRRQFHSTVPRCHIPLWAARTIPFLNHSVARWFGQSVSRALMIFAERASVGEMSRNEETSSSSSSRRADWRTTRRRAGPGRAGRAGPWSAAGRNLAVAPGKPSDDRKSAGDSQQRREAAKQKGRRKAVDSETG